MFNFPPMNHFTLGSVKFHSKVLSHFFFQTNCSACVAQKASGFSTERLYSSWYCSKEVIREFKMVQVTGELRIYKKKNCLSYSAMGYGFKFRSRGSFYFGRGPKPLGASI